MALPIAHLLADLKALIGDARRRTAQKVNAELTILYWEVGQRIRTEILDEERAAYGQQILENLSDRLTSEFGRGWSERQLRYCIRFAEVCPDQNILHTLCAKLSWSHIRLLIYLEDHLKRQFYVEMCQLENWSVRQLAERTQSLLYERTALSKKPEETVRMELEKLRAEQTVSPDLLLKDPYVLDFLGLVLPHGRITPKTNRCLTSKVTRYENSTFIIRLSVTPPTPVDFREVQHQSLVSWTGWALRTLIY